MTSSEGSPLDLPLDVFVHQVSSPEREKSSTLMLCCYELWAFGISLFGAIFHPIDYVIAYSTLLMISNVSIG